MEYSVHTTKRFDEEVEKLSSEEMRRIENIIQQLLGGSITKR